MVQSNPIPYLKKWHNPTFPDLVKFLVRESDLETAVPGAHFWIKYGGPALCIHGARWRLKDGTVIKGIISDRGCPDGYVAYWHGVAGNSDDTVLIVDDEEARSRL